MKAFNKKIRLRIYRMFLLTNISRQALTAVAMLMALISSSTTASAGTIDSVGTYRGTISSVAYNFISGTGVGLTDGATCNGKSVVILLNSNPQFKDMLAILMPLKCPVTMFVCTVC
jgi:hypothetical protein